MNIELTAGVNWNTDLQPNEQTQEALAWMTENVKSKRAFDATSENVQPEWDEYGRPKQWVMTVGNIEVTVIWNYQKPESTEWAKFEDAIIIKTL